MNFADGIEKMRGILITCLFILIAVSNAYADQDFSARMFSDDKATEKYIFDLTETPWIYVQLPQNGLNVTSAWWESSTNEYYVTSYAGVENNIWFSLDDGIAANSSPTTWENVKKPGEWEINVSTTFYANGVPTYKYDAKSFTVNPAIAPEPVSSLLFLAGSATLAGRRFLKNRKK